jgi:hypothetical protein
MTRIAIIFATVALSAGIAPAFADGMAPTPNGPKFYQSPTDETLAPPARRAPRARARAESSEMSDLFQPRPAAPPTLGSGGTQVYTYQPMVDPRPTYYYYAPTAPQGVYDNAPCPSMSRYSLAQLFTCTQ